MNIVLEDGMEIVNDKEQNKIGMVVIRGNSIIQMELIEYAA